MERLTIEEAIAFCHEKSNNIKLKAEPQVFIQLAERLEELKVYKKNSDIYPICDTYCSYLAEEFENGYNKAIDDFVNACKQDILCQTFGLHANGIERIAEQLKRGGENDG